MAKLDYKDIYSKLGKRTEWYALAVRDTFQKRIGEIVAMCEELDINEDKPFAFADYKDVAPAVQAKLRQLYSEVYQSLRGNIVREWNYANDTTDKLVKGLFGKHSIEDKHYARYFQRNKEAMNSFFERRQDGLNLSQRVWQYVGQAKTDLEVALDLGIGQGLSSDTLNRKVKQYLNNPDDLFRRFRYKVGEDEEGNPIYGRKWKRRRYDKETDTFYWVDDNPKNYHTGQGVYRSSYKNAMRLARTETNMAYRTADITRWQQMEFVLGYEVKLSHNHPCTDICDDLQGKYPKEFVFKGWHPHCYCYIVPILCKDNELEQLTEAILNGEDTSTFAPAGMITDVPAGFTGWIAGNEERIRNAASLPYFITDNYKNGEIGKGFKWLREHKNEAGLANFKKVLANKELELEAINKVQPLTAKEFAECSNYVEAGKAGGFPICTTPPATGVQFEELSKLADKEELAAIMQEAAKGNNTLSTYTNSKELAELEKIATQAKFASKTEVQFVAVLDNDALGAAIKGDTGLFASSRYIGSNYSNLCSVALENGSIAADTGATCVIKLPAGSRYLQTTIGGEHTAMLLPNTKLKVTGKEVKAITHAGKTTNITHYTLEVVNDGSSFVKSIAEIKTQVEAEVTAYKKAVKAANNVINAANKWHYGLLGVDTAPLQAIVKSESSIGISKATKVLAKEMAGAKKLALAEYENMPNLYGLTLEFGEANAKVFMENWAKHIGKSSIYDTDELFLKKVIQKELYYAKLNPNKYPTTQKFIYFFEKLEEQYNTKIAIKALQPDVDAAIVFAQTTKSTKVKTLVAELQQLISSQMLDESAIKAKLETAQKEIDRLNKERLARLIKKGIGKGSTSKYDMTSVYSAQEAKEYNRLHAEFQKALLNNNGDYRASAVLQAQNALADYVTDLGVKYQSINPKLPHIGGYTDAEVKKAIKDYLTHKTNTNGFGVYSGSIGGEYESAACESYAKKIGLPAKELSILRRYTAGSNFVNEYAYKADDWINWAMPKMKQAGVYHEFVKLIEDYLKAYNGVCEKMPRYNSHTYRGVRLSKPAAQQMLADIQSAYNSGKEWISLNPMSTTRDIRVADGFGTDLTFLVRGKTGVDVNPISRFMGEDEYVFRAGSKFRVLRVYKATKPDIARVGSWCVELEEIL